MSKHKQHSIIETMNKVKTINNTMSNTISIDLSVDLYIDFYESPLGRLVICATNDYVTLVQFVASDAQAYAHIQANPNYLTTQTIEQLTAYFAGIRRQFDLPIKQQGSKFQQQVWQALLNVDYGMTVSYKQIATIVGNEKASRAVGMANNRNKIAIIIPCHRVIGSNGKLTGYAGGIDIKKQLLLLESS